MPAFIDKILSIAISKKLTVFILVTVFTFNGIVTGKEFMSIAMVYLGVQGSIDIVKEYLKK